MIRTAITGTLLIALAAGAPAPAAVPGSDEARVQFVRQLSGATPFTGGCGDPSGDAIVDSEVEAHLAVSPTDPDHLLATWQQDRYSNGGGARSDLVAVSRDGGDTWSAPLQVPGISSCTDPGNPLTRVTDPWGAIGPDGTAYLASLAFNTTGVEPDEAEQVSVSPDGGFTWKPKPAVIEADDGFLEREVIAADPAKPGHAYMVYQVLDQGPPSTTDGFTRFARTEDGGGTWTDPKTIPPAVPGIVELPDAIVPIPRPDGGTTLVVILVQISAATRNTAAGPWTFASIRSEDLGETWSAPSEIVTFAENFNRGDPEEPAAIQPGASSAAVAPDGALYVAWAEHTPIGTSPGGTDVRVARSDDAGDTWTTSTIASFPHIASLPTVAVARDGTVGVMWYDARNDVPLDDEFTMDLWFAWSADRGASWRELHLAGPFDMRKAPRDGGGFRWFLGDYAGLVGFPRGFGALFPLPPGEGPPTREVVGPSDIFYARIKLDGPALGSVSPAAR